MVNRGRYFVRSGGLCYREPAYERAVIPEKRPAGCKPNAGLIKMLGSAGHVATVQQSRSQSGRAVSALIVAQRFAIRGRSGIARLVSAAEKRVVVPNIAADGFRI